MTSTVLGEGASAMVRLGYEKQTQSKVAIKVIPKLDGKDPVAVEKRCKAVKKEIEILRFLSSLDLKTSSLIELLDVIEDENAFHLVFDYKPSSLYSCIKQKKRFGEEEAKKLFKQLAAAVAVLHKHKIAHRDIKVENILIGEDQRVFLCDFGFASNIVPGVSCREWCGSPFTVAPEILQRTPYSPEAVDVWAMGSVLYTLLCGSFPFHGSSPAEVSDRTKQGRLHPFPSHVSRSARDLVSRCLTLDAGKRIKISHILDHPFLWDDEEEGFDYDSDEDEEEEGEDAGECSGEEYCAPLSALSQESGEGLTGSKLSDLEL